MGRLRRILAIACLALIGVGVTVVLVAPLQQGQPADDGGLIGTAAPPLSSSGAPALDLDGETVDLDRLRGQVVWINFWTTSCVPCRTEMPAMQRLAELRAADGLRVIGINVGDGAGSVRAFVEDVGVDYPIMLDTDSAIFNRYSPLFGVPRHYFVGRDGTIVAARIGELQPDEMEPLVDSLLGS